MKVRTRVAPSPTGDPHVGTAYVALVNYCFARKHGGAFVLRIEDTDRSRSTRESEVAILASLHWLGLSWDEGPDAGGPHAPYRQSERSTIYRECVEQLLSDGHAFKCFCTPERLDAMRVAQRAAHQPPRYDGLCLTYSAEETARREAAGEPYVVRLVIPENETIRFNDLLHGPIEINSSDVDMQVLMKSDGFPTYHLANVVDDNSMAISHVIRGEEWISSTPKHLLLYRYLGWEPPQFAHLPLLRNPDRTKLSKRKNPTNILYFRDEGFLPEAVLNFLGTLADSRNDDPQMIGLDTGNVLARICDRFDLQHISKAGPIFDMDKLRWLNGQYLRRRTSADLLRLISDTGFEWPTRVTESNRERVAGLALERMKTVKEFPNLVGFLGEMPRVTRSDVVQRSKLSASTVQDALDAAVGRLARVDDWRAARIGEELKQSTVDRWPSGDVKFRDAVRAYYVAVTGSPTSLPLFDAMEILGKAESLERFKAARELLQ